MSNPDMLGQIQEGAQVVTNQREPIGRVTKIWEGSDPAGEDLASAIQDSEEQVTYEQVVQSGEVQGSYVEVDIDGGGTAYIPMQAVRAIEDSSVVLDVDQVAISASSWHERPPTLGQETASRAVQPEAAIAPAREEVVTPRASQDTGTTEIETPAATQETTTGRDRKQVDTTDTDVRVTGSDIRAGQHGGTVEPQPEDERGAPRTDG